jgi:hypothetical protein
MTMGALRDKTILIVSPQSWGKMFVSKHHYAVELARNGNRVYFLNPPLTKKDSAYMDKVSIADSGIHPDLLIVSHKISFPYNIKFHLPGLFHALMKPHIRAVLKALGAPMDIIWSFDLGNLYPFRLFPASALRVFHPVDEPLNQTAFSSAEGAEVIFSVTKEILDKYRACGAPLHFINHGLAREFLGKANIQRVKGNPLRVGLSGNFLRKDIDRGILLQIVRDNPAIVFECWGSYEASQSNISGNSDDDTIDFIASLRSMPNAILHGAVKAEELACQMHAVDAFLICYDINKDQSKGTNYHKIMEYLSTGKVIISNNVSTYQGQPDLLQMTGEREHNRNLPALFREVMGDLDKYNSPALQQFRVEYSESNSYQKQIQRIEEIITPLACK